MRKVNWGPYGALVTISYTNTYQDNVYGAGSYQNRCWRLFIGEDADKLNTELDRWIGTFDEYPTFASGSRYSHDPVLDTVSPIDLRIPEIIHATMRYTPWKTVATKISLSRKPVPAYYVTNRAGRAYWCVESTKRYEYNDVTITNCPTFSDPTNLHASLSGVIELGGWFDVSKVSDKTKSGYKALVKERFEAKLEAYREEQNKKLDLVLGALKNA